MTSINKTKTGTQPTKIGTIATTEKKKEKEKERTNEITIRLQQTLSGSVLHSHW